MKNSQFECDDVTCLHLQRGWVEIELKSRINGYLPHSIYWQLTELFAPTFTEKLAPWTPKREARATIAMNKRMFGVSERIGLSCRVFDPQLEKDESDKNGLRVKNGWRCSRNVKDTSTKQKNLKPERFRHLSRFQDESYIHIIIMRTDPKREWDIFGTKLHQSVICWVKKSENTGWEDP